MYYPQQVDIDVYGRAFDGIFGVGAQVKNHQQALMKLKAVRDFRSSVRKGEFIDSDLYGRADPRLFNQPHSESQPILTTTSSKTPKSFFSISIKKAKNLFPLSSSSNKSHLQHSNPSYQRLETVTSDSDFEQSHPNHFITNNDSDDHLPKRVKSKLPSEEEQPFVEPGYVARAIESLNSDIDYEQKEEHSTTIKSPNTNIQSLHSKSVSHAFSVQSSSEYSNVDRIISSPNISTEITNSTTSKDKVRRVQTTNTPSNYSNRTVYKENKNQASSQSPRSKSYGTPTNVQDPIGKSYSSSSAKHSSNSSISQPGGHVGRLAHMFETNQVQSTSTQNPSDNQKSTDEHTTKESFANAGLDNQTFSTSYEDRSTSAENATSSSAYGKKISAPRYRNLFSSNNGSNERSFSSNRQQDRSGSAEKSEHHDDELELVDGNMTSDRPKSKDALEMDPGVVPIAVESQYSSSSQKHSSMKSRSTASSDRLGKLRSMFRSRGSKASAGSSSTDRKSSSTDRKRSFLSRSTLRASGLRSGSRSRQLSNNSSNRFFRGRGRSDHSQRDSLAASADFMPSSSNDDNTNTKTSNENIQEIESGTSSAQVISSGSPQEYTSSRIIDSDRSAEAPSSTVIESSTTMEGEFEASEEVVFSNGTGSSKKVVSSSTEVVKTQDSDEILADSDEEFKFVDVDADVDDFIDADADEEDTEIVGQ